MTGFRGQQGPGDGNELFNASVFLIQQWLNRSAFATLVQIKAIDYPIDTLAPVGTVDVFPLVNQVDGNNNAEPHGTIFGVPYFRYQGGKNAILIEPQVGDIGIAIFADHDISSVIENKGQANPGSARRNSMADALYIGGFLNGTPEQYIQFSSFGIIMWSPQGIGIVAEQSLNIQSPIVQINAESAEIVCSTSYSIVAPEFNVDAPVQNLTGAVSINGSLTINGQLYDDHEHDVENVEGGSSTRTTTGVKP